MILTGADMKSLVILTLLSLMGCGPTIQGTPKVGPKGDTGAMGPAGLNGHSALFGPITSSPQENCPTSGIDSHGNYGFVFTLGVDLNDNGFLDNNEIQQIAIVCNGVNGTQGAPGIAGQNGSNGTNGTNGVQGIPGVSPLYSPVIIIQPCGGASSPYKEVLLGLSGGSILSEFSGSSNALTVRNTLLPDGGYEDTDDSFCTFSVSTDGNGNRTISWNSQTTSNGYHAAAGRIVFTSSTSSWAVQ